MKSSNYVYTNKPVYNIKETPFWLELNGYRLYFTSDFNRKNFVDRYEPRKETILTRLISYVPSRNKENLEGLNIVTMFDLYSTIEKRGFRVLNLSTGGEITCKEMITIKVSSSV